jgi:hypothetical protein
MRAAADQASLRRRARGGYGERRQGANRMKFSYSAVWDDVMTLLRSHGSLLFAIAGVFFLLPILLTGYLLPQPTPTSAGDVMGAMSRYYQENWPWLLLATVVNTIGSIAIYLLLFDGRGRTVGGAIAASLPILPFYFLMSILTGLAIGLGLGLFILPGLYLLGRLTLAPAVMVAEGQRSPLRSIGGSWALTRKRGWAVAGLVVIVALVGYLLSFVITAVLGSVFILLLGREGVGGFLMLILNAAVTSALLTVLLVLFAAIYRALRPAASPTSGT